jgi:3-dehydroshikimate dehydratase
VTTRPGLCSVTFRQLSVAQVVDVAAAAGLEGIEWGGDIHVPAGDEAAASDAAARCAGQRIMCPSYGSYLGARSPVKDPGPTLDTALAIGAPNVRVWCPFGLGAESAEEPRAEVTAGVAAIASAALARRLTVSLEFHPGTLTETSTSAARLLAEVDAPNLFTYWQPAPGGDAADSLQELAVVQPDLSHLHVFWWDKDGGRLPLERGAGLWPQALSCAAGANRWAGDRFAFLEFVAADDPAQLAADAATLTRWLRP